MQTLGLLLAFQTGQTDGKLNKWYLFNRKTKQNKKAKQNSLGFEDKKASLFPSLFLTVTDKLKVLTHCEWMQI